MNRSTREPRRRTRLPVLTIPVIFYLGMTIGVPLANGAASQQDFWEHAATTLAVTASIFLILRGWRR